MIHEIQFARKSDCTRRLVSLWKRTHKTKVNLIRSYGLVEMSIGTPCNSNVFHAINSNATSFWVHFKRFYQKINNHNFSSRLYAVLTPGEKKKKMINILTSRMGSANYNSHNRRGGRKLIFEKFGPVTSVRMPFELLSQNNYGVSGICCEFQSLEIITNNSDSSNRTDLCLLLASVSTISSGR